jgi:hypothetical protein
MGTKLTFAGVALFVVSSMGCGAPDTMADDDIGLDEPGLNFSSEQIRSVGSPPWVYAGSLPVLINPKVVVSQAGHTARVTGDVPSNWYGSVPYYATVETLGARRVLTVVYPIATGASAALDAQERTFAGVEGIPFRPNGIARPTTGPVFVTWGGFPFVAYSGGIAFHGPITHTTSTSNGEQVFDWYLQRGPVSHGCNRMQGEHVVEFAHLIGFHMRNTWQANARIAKRVTVQIMRGYDRLPSGEAVDVDYPRWAGAVAPTGPRRIFPTWNAEEMPRLVCADMRATRTINSQIADNFCDFMPANSRDLVTGNPTGPVTVDNGTAAFSSSSTFATYRLNPIRVGADYTAAMTGTAGTVTWNLPIVSSGRFQVWVRYAPDQNRNTRASYRMYTNGTEASGQAPVVVNQRLPGAQGWVSIGTQTLSAGAHVVLTATATSDGWTIADAVRIDPVR